MSLPQARLAVRTPRATRSLPVVILVLCAVAGASTGASHAVAQATTVTFDVPGTYTWTVPAGVAQATFDVFGAEGSPGEDGPAGGRGGRATATIAVTVGQEFQINVGAAGGITTGGFNGGGAGAVGHVRDGGGGGGASDVRTGAAPYGLEDRVIVGGGGGGASASGRDGGLGGAGGGSDGLPGVNGEAGGGGGGSQAGAGAGGAGGPGDENGENGSAGQGGRGGGSANDGGGGGGGGYYGGGGGGGGDNVGGGGGGGSGFGPAGVVFETGPQAGNGKVVITYDFVTPDPIVVTTTDDELNSDGDCSLREAIRAANTDLPVDACGAGSGPDNVSVPAGTYTLAIPGAGEDAAATGDLDVTADLAISGAGAATTIVDGADLDRVVHVVAGSVEVSGFTIRNGLTPDLGGAISNSGNLALTASIVSDSTGSTGGAIFNAPGATMGLTSSTVTGNTASGAGAIYNYSGSTLSVVASTISGNTATSGDGGGIYNRHDTGVLPAGIVTLENSTISGNTASSGAGIFNIGTLTATSTTITANTGTSAPGGLRNGASATLKNTIVAANPGGNCLGTITSLGHNLSSDSSCGLSSAGDLENVDPMLGPLADNGGPTETHEPLGGSSAIDAGSGDCPPPATDQRGVTRPLGPNCDIGAVEREFAPDPIVVNTTQDELNSDGDCALREAIRAANTDLPVDACGAGAGPDNISVPAGTYVLAIAGAGEDAAATGDLDITADLTISGADAATTIIDAADLDRVVHVVAGTIVEISGATIRNGSSLGAGGRGAGILNGGTLTLTGATISGNSAFQSGGGIDNFGPLTIDSSTISGNTVAGQGAGIGNYSSLLLDNSTVSGNTGAHQGGGIFHQNVGGLTLKNSTVTGNSGNPSSGGSGIYNFGSVSAKNTIVANNGSGSQCFAGTISSGNNLSSDGSCGFTASGDLENTDPLLGPLAPNGGPD